MKSADRVIQLASSLLLAGAVTAGCYRPPSHSQKASPAIDRFTSQHSFKPDTYREEYKIDPNAPESIVAKHTWVEVKNNYPISHQNGTREAGDRCSLDEGQTIKQVREADDLGQILAIYLPDSGRAGAQCAKGTLFEIPETTFKSSTQEFNEREMKRRIEDQLVADILAGDFSIKSPEKATIQIVPKVDWVDMQNPKNKYYDRYVQRSCFIDIRSKVQLVGEDQSQNRVLVRYQLTPNMGGGTACSDGTLFFLPRPEFDGMTADYQANGEERIRKEAELRRYIESERRRFTPSR